MKKLLSEIRACTICEEFLPHGPRPIVTAHPGSKIILIGQAPGRVVHESGVPWQDKSGENLRKWLGVGDEEFYDPQIFGIIPMGFCFPGTGKSGDLPPRKECAPQWHPPLRDRMKEVQLTILIGQYAQKYYLQRSGAEESHRNRSVRDIISREKFRNLRNYETYLPTFFPLPHPSPRNRYRAWQ